MMRQANTAKAARAPAAAAALVPFSAALPCHLLWGGAHVVFAALDLCQQPHAARHRERPQATVHSMREAAEARLASLGVRWGHPFKGNVES